MPTYLYHRLHFSSVIFSFTMNLLTEILKSIMLTMSISTKLKHDLILTVLCMHTTGICREVAYAQLEDGTRKQGDEYCFGNPCKYS